MWLTIAVLLTLGWVIYSLRSDPDIPADIDRMKREAGVLFLAYGIILGAMISGLLRT